MSKKSTGKGKPPRACIFCGDTGSLTREHMWPVWMHKYIGDLRLPDPHAPRPQPWEYWRVERNTDSPVLRVEPKVDMVQGFIHNKTFPVVCKDRCNGGWMKALEDQVSGFGGKMIRGELVSLSKEQATTLATWASLRAMIMELANRELIGTNEAQRHQLYKTQLPPETSRIWVGRYRGDQWHMRVRHHGFGMSIETDDGKFEPSPEINTQATTIVCGQLLVYVFSTWLPADSLPTGNLNVWGPAFDLLMEVWPRSRAFSWPLPGVVDDRAALVISDGLKIQGFDETGFHETADFLRSYTEKG